jgi:hypothetical protein
MDTYPNLRRFLDAIRNLTLWKRLFTWASIRTLCNGAAEEFVQLSADLRHFQAQIEAIRREKELLLQEKNSLWLQVVDSRTNFTKADSQIHQFQLEVRRLENENKELHQALISLKQKDEQRIREYDDSVQRMKGLHDSLEKEKQDIKNRQLQEMEERMNSLKETWRVHEDNVKNNIRSICERHTIEYVDSVPFKGKPDNVIRICDEYIVFDAKSPASDDLSNFSTYIRTQAESVQKYATHEGVRKDIYLVVPSNTMDVLKKYSFHQGNFSVFIITVDALEPVILSLKKQEEYEFAEQMSPDDRQNICRIIGGLLHVSKRRIQVDQFFNSHVLDMLSQTRREIPESIQDEIDKYDAAMKLNPPADRRSVEIKQVTLEKTHAQLDGQSELFKVDKVVGILLNTGS